jgi:hypothetical protein
MYVNRKMRSVDYFRNGGRRGIKENGGRSEFIWDI